MSEPGGGGGEDGSAGLEVSAVQNVADVSVLQKHLRKLVPLLLEDGGEAPAALEAALEEKSALEQMRKFLSDPQVHTVLVERSTLKGAGPRRAGSPGPSLAEGRACLVLRGRKCPWDGRILAAADDPGMGRAWRPQTSRRPGPQGRRRPAEADAAPGARPRHTHCPARSPQGAPLLVAGKGEESPSAVTQNNGVALSARASQDGRVGWRQRLPGLSAGEAASLPPMSHELFGFDLCPGQAAFRRDVSGTDLRSWGQPGFWFWRRSGGWPSRALWGPRGRGPQSDGASPGPASITVVGGCSHSILAERVYPDFTPEETEAQVDFTQGHQLILVLRLDSVSQFPVHCLFSLIIPHICLMLR